MERYVLGDGALAFREFVMKEPLPLATIHAAVLEFLRHRSDVVLFGAQAVNAYVDEARMTQDVDVISSRAGELAAELRTHLQGRFHIALRVREIGDGKGFRIFQARKSANRHLVDVRAVRVLPPSRIIGGIAVLTPEELVASKVIAWHQRRGKPKSFTDQRDLAVLLLRFPELKANRGPVRERLVEAGAGEGVLLAWREVVGQKITAEDDADEFE